MFSSKYLAPPEISATIKRVGVRLETMAVKAFSTSSLINPLDSPALASRILAVTSSSYIVTTTNTSACSCETFYPGWLKKKRTKKRKVNSHYPCSFQEWCTCLQDSRCPNEKLVIEDF